MEDFVLLPTTPSGISPTFLWNALIASLVYEPIFPSMIPGLNPLFDRYVCISDTESKFAPVLSLALQVLAASQPV